MPIIDRQLTTIDPEVHKQSAVNFTHLADRLPLCFQDSDPPYAPTGGPILIQLLPNNSQAVLYD